MCTHVYMHVCICASVCAWMCVFVKEYTPFFPKLAEEGADRSPPEESACMGKPGEVSADARCTSHGGIACRAPWPPLSAARAGPASSGPAVDSVASFSQIRPRCASGSGVLALRGQAAFFGAASGGARSAPHWRPGHGLSGWNVDSHLPNGGGCESGRVSGCGRHRPFVFEVSSSCNPEGQVGCEP